jgi:hypothetical protein
MKSKALLLAFVMFIPVLSFSQTGILRRAINRQVNNEIDSALDKKIQDEQNKNRAKEKAAAEQNQANQATDKQGDASQQSGNEGGGFGAKLFANKVDLKYDEVYNFTSRIYMQMESYEKNDVMKMDFNMFYSANSPTLGVETKTISTKEDGTIPMVAYMIVDGVNKSFLMLSEVNSMKMGMISAVPDEKAATVQPDGKPAKKVSTPQFTKTGNTRMVAGYKCDEYTYTNADDKTSGKVWFTREPKILVDKRGWSNTGMATYYGYEGFKDGIILASEANDDKGKLAMKSETIEINEKYPHSISTKGYTLRQVKTDQGAK